MSVPSPLSALSQRNSNDFDLLSAVVVPNSSSCDVTKKGRFRVRALASYEIESSSTILKTIPSSVISRAFRNYRRKLEEAEYSKSLGKFIIYPEEKSTCTLQALNGLDNAQMNSGVALSSFSYPEGASEQRDLSQSAVPSQCLDVNTPSLDFVTSINTADTSITMASVSVPEADNLKQHGRFSVRQIGASAFPESQSTIEEQNGMQKSFPGPTSATSSGHCATKHSNSMKYVHGMPVQVDPDFVQSIIQQNKLILERLTVLENLVVDKERHKLVETTSSSMYEVPGAAGSQILSTRLEPILSSSINGGVRRAEGSRINHIIEQLRAEVESRISSRRDTELEMKVLREKNRSLEDQLSSKQSRLAATELKFSKAKTKNRALNEENASLRQLLHDSKVSIPSTLQSAAPGSVSMDVTTAVEDSKIVINIKDDNSILPPASQPLHKLSTGPTSQIQHLNSNHGILNQPIAAFRGTEWVRKSPEVKGTGAVSTQQRRSTVLPNQARGGSETPKATEIDGSDLLEQFSFMSVDSLSRQSSIVSASLSHQSVIPLRKDSLATDNLRDFSLTHTQGVSSNDVHSAIMNAYNQQPPVRGMPVQGQTPPTGDQGKLYIK